MQPPSLLHVEERPEVTVSSPGRSDRPAELLALGAEPRPHRLPRWWVPAGAAAAVVGLLATQVVAEVRSDRARDRVAEAAAQAREQELALEDAVAVRAVVVDVLTSETGGGQIVAVVDVTNVGTRAVVVDGATLAGSFITETDAAAVSTVVVPGSTEQVRGEARLDCQAVEATRPSGLTLQLSVSPPSGRRRVVTPVAVLDEPTAQAAYRACNTGDPQVLPTAQVDVRRGQITLHVSVDNGRPATIEAVGAPGLLVRTPGFRIPHRLDPNNGVAFDVVVRVTDCASYRPVPLRVVISFDDGERAVLEAGPGTQPGSVAYEPFVAKLVERAC